MRIAGGVIAIVVGVIQTILMAIAVLFSGVADEIVEAAQEAQVEAGEAADPAAAAAISEAASAIGWVAWVLLIVSIVVVILGIMICAAKNPTHGLIVAIIGVVLLVLAIVQGGDILLPIIWNGLIILAGVLGYMGAKQENTAPAV